MAITQTYFPGLVDIQIDRIGRLITRFQDTDRILSDFRPLGYAIAKVLRASFAKNLDVGGRPRFVPLSPNTLAAKKIMGYPSTPLIRTGLLRTSLAQRNAKGNVTYVSTTGEVRVGSNLPYAKFMQYGTRPHVIEAKKAKALAFFTVNGKVLRKRVRHPGTPPRPFMLIQKEDWAEIHRLLQIFLAGQLPTDSG